MAGEGVRRRRRRPAGKFARVIARRLAARVDRPASATAQALGTAAGEAATGAATWAAGHVGAIYRAVADEASGAGRTRALRARNRVPLPSLHVLHPEASGLPVRSLGILPVSVDEIAGTAVAGPDQRGSDFRPLPAFRSPDWHARWLRIRTAVTRMEPLPPVDLQKYAGRYWVVDGHNRIAAALYEGQVAVDAVVQELVPPGAPQAAEAVSLAAEMADGTAIRTAAAGRRPSLALRLGREADVPRLEMPTPEPVAGDLNPDIDPGIGTDGGNDTARGTDTGADVAAADDGGLGESTGPGQAP